MWICFSVIDFLGFTPSTVAAAAVLCAAGESVESAAAEDQAGAVSDEGVNKVINHGS